MRNVFIIFGIAVVSVVIGVAVFVRSYGAIPAAIQPASTTAAPSTPVLFTELAHGTNSTVATRANYIIKSSAELTQLWKMIDARGQSPTIDFTENAVVAVFAGKEPTAGYSIDVSQVADSGVRKVMVTLTKPGFSCLLAETTTSPYQVIELPKTTLPLTHEDQTITASCLQ